MQHKGEIVEKAVRESGYPITKLAQKLGKSRRWMYHVFETANVSLDHIIAIGKIIHHDFYAEINELKNPSREFGEARPAYPSEEKDVTYWRDKYYELLEEHNALLKKLRNIQSPPGGE